MYGKNSYENVGVATGLDCLLVPVSFVFYTIKEKCQLEVSSAFCCGTGSLSQCVLLTVSIYSTVATFWLFSLVMFG